MRGTKPIHMKVLEELRKTENLKGEELELALLSIKERYNTPSDREQIKAYLFNECNQLEDEISKVNIELKSLIIKEQLKDKYEILPISYIAKNYFNKSAAWLYQRINGTKVRGRVYTLNEREKEVFNIALQDISKEIGSVSIV